MDKLVTFVVDYDNDAIQARGPDGQSVWQIKANRFDHKFSLADVQDILYEVINGTHGFDNVSLQSQSDGDLHTIGEW